MALMVTIWCDALVEVRLGDAERVAVADQMSSLVDKFALAQGRTRAAGFVLGRTPKGTAARGLRQIREAYEENRRSG